LASGTLKTIYSWDQAFGYNTAGSASATWGQDALNPLSGC
jgi:hypothetical protein